MRERFFSSLRIEHAQRLSGLRWTWQRHLMIYPQVDCGMQCAGAYETDSEHGKYVLLPACRRVSFRVDARLSHPCMPCMDRVSTIEAYAVVASCGPTNPVD